MFHVGVVKALVMLVFSKFHLGFLLPRKQLKLLFCEISFICFMTFFNVLTINFFLVFDFTRILIVYSAFLPIPKEVFKRGAKISNVIYVGVVKAAKCRSYYSFHDRSTEL